MFPMWSGQELLLPSLLDSVKWVHSQMTRDSFQLDALLRLAAPLAQQDSIHRELRSALIYWKQWTHLSRRACDSHDAPRGGWELHDRAQQIAYTLPPIVPLELFEAERVRHEFASFVELINSECLPQLRLHWRTTAHQHEGEAAMDIN